MEVLRMRNLGSFNLQNWLQIPYLFILIASLFSSFTLGDTHGEFCCELITYYVFLLAGQTNKFCNFLLRPLFSYLYSFAFLGFRYVTCGSVVKLLNPLHNVRLHSHEVKYGSGSGQQVYSVASCCIKFLDSFLFFCCKRYCFKSS